MQQTFHKPDEAEGRHGLRMASSLEKDYNFADYSMADYDERAGFIQQASRSTMWFVKNLFFYTRKRWIVRAGWILEFLTNIVLLVVAHYQIKAFCIIEIGSEVMCYSCYGLPFLVWTFSFSLLWLLNVYMHVLLISRGFAFPKQIGKVLEENRRKGIPGIAVVVFMLLMFLMMAMVIGGIVLLVNSNNCPSVDHIAGVRTLKRSETLFWAIIIVMVIASMAVPLVRFSEVIFKEKQQDELEAEYAREYGTLQKYADKARQKEHEYFNKFAAKKQEYVDKFGAKKQEYLDKFHEKEHEYANKFGSMKQEYVDKLHEKEQVYLDKFQDYRGQLKEKGGQLKEKAAQQGQIYYGKLNDKMDNLRNHGEYLDKFRGHHHGQLNVQTL